MSDVKAIEEQGRIFGHPAGLYTLFFAEMWERFSYYGMRALLIFYMTKDFLGYGDTQAYSVYGFYTSLVYMTPFIGGMLADKFLGQRTAVVIGGTLMAAGHLLMSVRSEWPFFFALALLIVGNGFFKPNISSMVGTLYAGRDPRRDDGFNIFYTGINLGAAISPLLCGYVGETYGWHYGFGLATIGMLIGLAVFVMPTLLTSALIMLGAIATTGGLLFLRPDNYLAIGINVFVGLCLMISAIVACTALSRGGLPAWAGEKPKDANPKASSMIYGGILVAVPIFALLVSGFSPFMSTDEKVDSNEVRMAKRVEFLEGFGVEEKVIAEVKEKGIDGELVARGKPYQLLDKEWIASVKKSGAIGNIAGVFLAEVSKPAGLVLTILGILAFGYLILETFKLEKIPRERMMAALVLIFFNMLFFAFFEQAGSSINLFTDRNVDRVEESEVVTKEMVGKSIRIQPTQAQFGYERNGKRFDLTDLTNLRKYVSETGNTELTSFDIEWTLTESNVGMPIAERKDELPASIFQSFNAIYILIFALLFNLLWSYLRSLGLDPSAPVKFGLGLVQLGLGFGALYMGAQAASDQGFVWMGWLSLGILLHTTGELCLSPVGLSAMTKLSPKVLVSTLMGGWFLATAFSQYLAAIISQFTSVSSEGGGDTAKNSVPLPTETVNVYGDVFKTIAYCAVIGGIICLVISPLLKRWMHEEEMKD